MLTLTTTQFAAASWYLHGCGDICFGATKRRIGPCPKDDVHPQNRLIHLLRKGFYAKKRIEQRNFAHLFFSHLQHAYMLIAKLCQ